MSIGTLNNVIFMPDLLFFSEAIFNLKHGMSPKEVAVVLGSLVLCFVIGLILGKLIFGHREEQSHSLPEKQDTENKPALRKREDNPELEWRHEKLALTEQQNVDRHRRLASWVEGMESASSPDLLYPGGCLFFLSESIRNERNQVGSDLSRFAFAQKRIGKLSDELLPVFGEGLVPENLTAWRQQAKDCLEDTTRHSEILKDRQNRLRTIFEQVSELGDRAADCSELDDELLEFAKSSLSEVCGELSDLPNGGIHKATGQLDKRLVELLQESPKDDPDAGIEIPKDQFAGLQRILAVDGGISGEIGKAGLLAAGERARRAFGDLKIATIEEDVESETDQDHSGAIVVGASAAAAAAVAATSSSDLRPKQEEEDGAESEAESSSPPSQSPEEEKTKKKEEPPDEVEVAGIASTEEEDKDKEKETPAMADEDYSAVIFCSNDPDYWNRDIYRGSRARARKISGLPDGFNWLGIRRMDTGEQVFCEAEKEKLLTNGDGAPVGFNGSNELFYDARHLGLFAESCAGEVETRFTYGGWGFGHRVNGFDAEPDPGPPQAAGWGGKEIPMDTVFEITVHSTLPDSVEDSAVISQSKEKS